MKCAREGCTTGHEVNPLSAAEAHHRAHGTLNRAALMNESDARVWLRVNFQCISLELRGWCSSCVLQAQTSIYAAVSFDTIAAVRETEQALEAASAPLHVCKVYPFRQPLKDAAHIGNRYDGASPPKPGGW